MSEFNKVISKLDLDTLDDDELLSGYRAGINGNSEPGSDKSRSFWHGWRNGMVDSGRAEKDLAQINLASEVVRAQKAH